MKPRWIVYSIKSLNLGNSPHPALPSHLAGATEESRAFPADTAQAATLFRTGRVDEVHVILEPNIIGTPHLDAPYWDEEVALELLDIQPIPEGTLLRYRVVKEAS